MGQQASPFSWWLFWLAVVAAAGQANFAEPRFYPLTQQEAVDESTLDPVILTDWTVASRTHPDRQVRWARTRFFSHDWKDGPWHATMTVAMPPKIRRERLGLAAITLAGVGKEGWNRASIPNETSPKRRLWSLEFPWRPCRNRERISV